MIKKLNNYLIFNQDTLLVKTISSTFEIPNSNLFNNDFLETYKGFLISESADLNVYSFDVDDTFEIPSDYSFISLREARDHHLDLAYLDAIQGLHVLNWSRKHKYCGVCGSKFDKINSDRSKKCSNCGNILFPQTSMAVITGIFKDGQILLAHNTNFPQGLYSLIAGFVELGETLENAVQREIMEEVGLKVKNIRYFGSQPWPFPNSMMIGFLADYDSGEINTDDIEIESAHWYTPENFPEIPHGFSIARKIIDYYTTNKKSL